jgi:hypothetical protein
LSYQPPPKAKQSKPLYLPLFVIVTCLLLSSSYIYATIANFVWMFPISLTSISALVRFKLALCQPAKEINVCGTHYFINQCHSLMTSTSHQELLFLDLDAHFSFFYLFIYMCYWTWQLELQWYYVLNYKIVFEIKQIEGQVTKQNWNW